MPNQMTLEEPWVEGSPSGWFVCISHWITYKSNGGYTGESGIHCSCPKDPRANDAALQSCHVAGSFPTESRAQRWVLRREVEQIEQETDSVLAASK